MLLLPENIRYKNHIITYLFLFFLTVTGLTGCSSPKALPPDSLQSTSPSGTSSAFRVNQKSEESMEELFRSLPKPVQDGLSTLEGDSICIDISHADYGYYYVSYTGDNSKVKFQITGPDQIKYTYNLIKQTVCLPISGGSGNYSFTAYENIAGDQYATLYKGDFSVSLENPYYPYLYSNMYVNYADSTSALQLAGELYQDTHSDLEFISSVYHYITENITYDEEKANTVAYNYLPVLDQVLEEKKGICFDYASLMAGMLRSQSIPTRLQIGYAGDLYHAWISTYVQDVGWIDNIIQFDGNHWNLMDPTFAANGQNSSTVKKFIGDGSNYNVLYTY